MRTLPARIGVALFGCLFIAAAFAPEQWLSETIFRAFKEVEEEHVH